jgi:hypothetical protein
MFYLYMDNFRGFQDTLIPIKDVNFLVGENSTGKTSVMALLNILSGLGFWMISTRFEAEEMKLGNYQDIVSAHVKDKKYFRVGMCVSREGEESQGAYLITYKEREGMPAISRYTCKMGGKLVDVIFATKSLRFRREEKSGTLDGGIETAKEWFETWRRRHDESKGSYTSIRGATKFGLMRSLGALNAYLLSEEKEIHKGRGRHISITVPTPYPEVTWLAPIRTKPKRTYDEYNLDYSPEGEHTPYLIKKYFRRKEEKERFLKFVRTFGVNSGLFKTIEVKNFGRTTTAPFELDVSLNDTVLKIVNVGYGVSQALPVVVELFEEAKGTCYLIQQPEVHLHPKAQAAMGELFFELTVNEHKKFIVETHSDFIIDRFRLKLRDSENKPEAQVLYFTRDSRGNRVYPIEILASGDFTDKQPLGYREFFVREQMNILGL